MSEKFSQIQKAWNNNIKTEIVYTEVSKKHGTLEVSEEYRQEKKSQENNLKVFQVLYFHHLWW